MRNVFAIVATLALSTAAYGQDPQVINPRALFPEGPVGIDHPSRPNLARFGIRLAHPIHV